MADKKDKKTYQIHIDPIKESHFYKDDLLQKQDKEPEFIGPTLGDKIWNMLRFLSSSAIIFIVIFFAMNWNAYSSIVASKLGFLKPSAQETTIETDIALSVKGKTQNLMNLSKDSEIQKTQIPQLSLDVTPPDTRIVIPRIGINVPVVTVSPEALIDRDWNKLEQQIQEALRDGVVHYPSTAFPDEEGNVVITGHSSYFPWDPGRFKDVFALLHQVQVGDKVYMYYNQKKYAFEVYETKVVLPNQVDVLTQNGENRLTLITCTPVGTNLKRLVVIAKPA
ncbi:class D sortase [bacterium]|nr:class D sortase [bacterium]